VHFFIFNGSSSSVFLQIHGNLILIFKSFFYQQGMLYLPLNKEKRTIPKCFIVHCQCSGYELDNEKFVSWQGEEISCSPERLGWFWGALRLLLNTYECCFPREKRFGPKVDH
jgi:hypothetical protein